MASGTLQTPVGSHWRLQLEWTSTPDVANNRSTVVTKFYWMGLTQYSAVYASSSNSGTSVIDGTNSNFSATPALSNYQKKLLREHSKVVTHDSDGSKRININANFDLNVNLAGSYVGNRSVSGTITLDNIPRSSSITSSANWTAGNNLSINVSRANSSFTHIARVYVDGTQVYATSSGSKFGTSVTASLNHTTVFNRLAQGSSKSTRVELDTYSGNTKVGDTVSITGTCTAPASSTTSASSSVNIGSNFTVSISRNNSSFTHSILLKTGSTVLKTYTGQGTSTSFVTSDIANAIYGLIPSSNEIELTIECLTYYDGVQVQGAKTRRITAKVVNSDPSFSNNFTYHDSNSTTVGITGNNSYIIQGISTVVAQITSGNRANAVNGASMVSYIATLNGQQRTANWSSSGTVSFSFGIVNASSNITLSIRAIDSRGNSTTTTKVVNVIPYQPPAVTSTSTRKWNFESETTITCRGSVSPLIVAGTPKNSISFTRYRFKETTSGTWGSWNNFGGTTYNATTGVFSRTSAVLEFDSSKSYNIQVEVRDQLQTTPVSRTLPIGQPTFFIDRLRNAVGIGGFPSPGFSFEVNGNANIVGNFRVGGNVELVSSSESGYLTFERTATHPVKWDVDMGWGGWGVRNLTNDVVGFHIDRTGNMRIGTRATSHSHKLVVDGTTLVSGALDANGGINLPNINGTTRSISINNTHNIGLHGSDFTMYTNRADGGFKVRTHFNGSSYRDDFAIGTNGQAYFNQAATFNSTIDASGNIYAANGGVVGSRNAANNSASVYLSFIDNIASIRYGGSGNGASGGFAIRKTGDNIIARFEDNGRVWFSGINGHTTSAGANCYISSSGYIMTSTSSARYKKDIEDLWEEEFMKVLDLRPVYYKSTNEDDREDWTYVGLLAEEVHKVEPRLVHYREQYKEVMAENGKKVMVPLKQNELVPNGVQYDRLPVYLLGVVKHLVKRVHALENR